MSPRDSSFEERVAAEVKRQIGNPLFELVFERARLNGQVVEGDRDLWAGFYAESPDDARMVLARRWESA